ncbi:MAG: hypothetical protein JW819_09935 [Candidatus Krumholzibacteriota bacterium]|nr:hypothetical protein [Candidatus Krumholzibacteriota bacterium]
MKKSVIALAMGLMLLASGAMAFENNLIGIFAEPEALTCAAAAPVGMPMNIYIIAWLVDIPAITAAEFRIDNYTGNPGYPNAIVTQTWNSPLTVGTIDEGFSIAFTEAQPGPIVELGHIEYLIFNPTFPGEDYKMCVAETLDSGNLVVVDAAYVTIPVDGWCFVFNCVVGGPNGNCECLDTIPVQDSNWGAVKALY